MGHFSLRFWLRDVCEAALICANALRGTFHFWQPRGLRNMVLPAGFVASPRRTACLARRSSGKIIRAAACLELVAKLGGRPPPTGWCDASSRIIARPVRSGRDRSSLLAS